MRGEIKQKGPAIAGPLCVDAEAGYFAAWIMISTFSAGLASLASTGGARAGVLPGATQASHTRR
jgi:hypothetical protein